MEVHSNESLGNEDHKQSIPYDVLFESMQGKNGFYVMFLHSTDHFSKALFILKAGASSHAGFC